ncbi:MAG: M20/M25/M40 family metallo-hydrolase [Thermodesulfobacteriota bacterium]
MPTKARAVVNFRILNGNNISGVIDHVRQTVDDSRVQVKPIGKIQSEPSPVSDIHSSSFDVLQRTIRQVFPEVIVAPGTVIGATDSRHYVNLSRNIYRFFPIWIGPEDIQRIHGTDERISIENYEQIVGFYYQLIRNSDSHLEIRK